MAIQMGLIILLGTLGGQWLDKRWGLETPYMTITLALLSIFVALYIALKDFFVSPNDNGED